MKKDMIDKILVDEDNIFNYNNTRNKTIFLEGLQRGKIETM
jgi:hypothetical protein